MLKVPSIYFFQKASEFVHSLVLIKRMTAGVGAARIYCAANNAVVGRQEVSFRIPPPVEFGWFGAAVCLLGGGTNRTVIFYILIKRPYCPKSCSQYSLWSAVPTALLLT